MGIDVDGFRWIHFGGKPGNTRPGLVLPTAKTSDNHGRYRWTDRHHAPGESTRRMLWKELRRDVCGEQVARALGLGEEGLTVSVPAGPAQNGGRQRRPGWKELADLAGNLELC